MMENTTNVNEQQAADQRDAFLEAFMDGAEAYAADQPAETSGQSGASEETVSETTPTVEASADNNGASEAETTAEKPEVVAEPAKTEIIAEPSWVIKHFDEQKTISAKDITPEVLQKGYDYDRIRAKYDEAKPLLEMFSAEASRRGISVAEYAKLLRTESKKAEGMTDVEARRSVELEDREAAVSVKEKAQMDVQKAEEARRAKINAELAEFAKAFPDAYNKAASDPKSIPQSVYDAWKGGEVSLTAAYAQYIVGAARAEAEQAEKRAATEVQNVKNATRSSGSMKSAGSDVKNTDPFLRGFNDL